MGDVGDAREQFERDGVSPPIGLLDLEEVSELRTSLERVVSAHLKSHGHVYSSLQVRPWEEGEHPLEAVLLKGVELPQIRECLETFLGPDILLRNIDVFWKDPVPWSWVPRSTLCAEETIEWHCDELTSPLAEKMATLWIALTPVTHANGAITYKMGSHRLPLSRPIVSRERLALDDDQLSELASAEEWEAELQIGQGVLHQGNIVHRSKMNSTQSPRIGIALRVMTAGLPSDQSGSSSGLLLSGEVPGDFQTSSRVPISWWRPRDSEKAATEAIENDPLWLVVEEDEEPVEDEIHGEWQGDGSLCIEAALSLNGRVATGPKGWNQVRSIGVAVFAVEEEHKGSEPPYIGPAESVGETGKELATSGGWRRGRGWWSQMLSFTPKENTRYELRVAVALVDHRLGLKTLPIEIPTRERGA